VLCPVAPVPDAALNGLLLLPEITFALPVAKRPGMFKRRCVQMLPQMPEAEGRRAGYVKVLLCKAVMPG